MLGSVGALPLLRMNLPQFLVTTGSLGLGGHRRPAYGDGQRGRGQDGCRVLEGAARGGLVVIGASSIA